MTEAVVSERTHRQQLQRAIRTADRAALFEAIKAAPGWNENNAHMVHDTMVSWAERVLAATRSPDDDSCLELYDLLGRLRNVHPTSELEAARPGTALEWRGIEQVIDERIARLDATEDERELVRGRRHVDRIERLLARGERTQSELREALNRELAAEVSEATLSQVLRMMEDVGLIERFQSNADKRGKVVRLVGHDTPDVRGIDLGWGAA
ncbi:MAG: hypothetical protein AAF513_00795 [Pseudomonadota bacterium]